MKINIQILEGTTDPSPTTLTYTKALWRKNHVVLTGTATCQGKKWDIKHCFYIPCAIRHFEKKEILDRILILNY
jgi:hypothetical protein